MKKTLLLLIMIMPAAFAAPQKQLQLLNNKISSLSNSLNQAQINRHSNEQILASIETKIGGLQVSLNKTRKKMSEEQSTLKDLQTQENQIKSKLNQQKKILATHMKGAYMMGRKPALKLLLNQTDPNKVDRMIMYYRYLANNRLKLITSIEVNLNELAANEQAQQQELQNLKALQTTQLQERQDLLHAKSKRQNVIRIINRNIKNKQTQLQVLKANKLRLEQALKQLQYASHESYAAYRHFGRLRGKLYWPTKGKITTPFGTKILQTGLRWKGVLIQAPVGQPVYAVAPGKVVFARWLAGYGLLLIINHGQGYMTLYGRNHSLYVKVGDQVRVGELIATVGKTGGYQKAALYFAIRHDGKPINPSKWATRSPRQLRRAA